MTRRQHMSPSICYIFVIRTRMRNILMLEDMLPRISRGIGSGILLLGRSPAIESGTTTTVLSIIVVDSNFAFFHASTNIVQ